MKKILIADDNLQITKVLSEFAKKEGFEPVVAQDGDAALALFQSDTYAVLLLDVMMPGMDGFSLCREIRRTSNVPIIMITARSEDYERIMGLDIGADDYIVKPFSPGEVMARIRAVMRRIPTPEQQETLVIGTLSIHLPSLSVTLDGHKLDLTRRETELLYTLASAPGRVFTRENLLTMLWGYGYVGNGRAVDSHIKRLRQKLDAYPHDFFTIATVWGAGYRFERKLP